MKRKLSADDKQVGAKREKLVDSKVEFDQPQASLNVPLLQHQVEALTWMVEQENGEVKGGLLADEQGLGKTISMIALMLTNGSRRNSGASSNGLEGGTLVVCPLSVMNHWANELRSKIRAPGLSTCMYHGNGRISITAEQLATYDVVITSYGTVGTEVPKGSRPLAQVLWTRVVLDEAHKQKNVKLKVSVGCKDLNATWRWAISGTPLQNKVEDLYSYMRFLQLKPYCEEARFNELIVNPYYNDLPSYNVEVKKMLGTILLRRTKGSMVNGRPILNLPPKSTELVHCEFMPEERAFYNKLASKYAREIKEYDKQGSLNQHYIHVVIMLLRLRQACNSPNLLPNDLQETNNVDHIEFRTSAKIKAVFEILAARPSGEKALIFSQWTKMLDLLGQKLSEFGVDYVRLDGTMRVKNRQQIIANFTTKQEVTVMLVSLKAAGVGINLVAANHVILCDSWWNPATEEQAIDRVHRIGQTRPVHVSKLVVPNTIEQTILELQESKNMMVEAVFEDTENLQERTRTDVRLNMQNLRHLLTGIS